MMKAIRLALVMISSLIMSMSGCQKEVINDAAIKLENCDSLNQDLPILETVKDAETIITQYVRESPTGNQNYYFIRYPSVPTGYLGVCNLPDDFKQDGIRIRFSGKIYRIENIHLKNMTSIPAELTSIRKISSK